MPVSPNDLHPHRGGAPVLRDAIPAPEADGISGFPGPVGAGKSTPSDVRPKAPKSPSLPGWALVRRRRLGRGKATLRCQTMRLRGTLTFPFAGSEATP